jgi:hypothetical protein
MRPLALIFLALAMSACAQQVAANDDATCKSYGAYPGSEAYLRCRLTLSQQHQAGMNSLIGTMNAIGAASGPSALPYGAYRAPGPTITNCTNWDGQIQCITP